HEPGELNFHARGQCGCSLVYFALFDNAELRASSGYYLQARCDWRSVDVPQRLSPVRHGHESLLNNYTVSANAVAGIRWFELQRTQPGNWGIFQQSTYQPDTTWRWMGSIASDNQGNIALGFSASSSSINPQIRYAGRLATDP